MGVVGQLAAQFPAVLLARRNLSRASVRSFLAILAVIIGVVAVGGIGVGGEAFKSQQLAAYEGFGGTATVNPVWYRDEPDTRAFSAAELDRMRQAAGSATVLPVIEPGGLVRTGSGELLPTAQVKALGDPGAFYDAQEGEIPDNWRRSVVVGSRVANENDIEVGDQIRVVVPGEVDQSFRVAAVLQGQGFSDPLSADQTVFVPLSSISTEEYDTVIIRVDPQTGSVSEAAAAIETEFNTRRDRVRVDTVNERREQFEQSFELINQFLVGIGGISLLVAAVTIANAMLMAAIEREGEIGVMRAVGYPKWAVVRLLVAEATMIGLIGAAVGAPLTLGIGMVLNEFLLGDPLAFTAAGLRYVGVGVAFGVLTALVAGLYPAWKAANKRPVEVLD